MRMRTALLLLSIAVSAAPLEATPGSKFAAKEVARFALRGTVRDRHGQAVPGATVVAILGIEIVGGHRRERRLPVLAAGRYVPGERGRSRVRHGLSERREGRSRTKRRARDRRRRACRGEGSRPRKATDRDRSSSAAGRARGENRSSCAAASTRAAGTAPAVPPPAPPPRSSSPGPVAGGPRLSPPPTATRPRAASTGTSGSKGRDTSGFGGSPSLRPTSRHRKPNRPI
jgi:hypothetical protein